MAANGEARVALVTGGSRGIGRGIVSALLEEGWTVAFGSRALDSVEAAVRDLKPAHGTRVAGAAVDVRDAAAVATWVEEAHARFGRIDALINNAGIAVFKPMLDVTLEEWQRVLAVNLTGPFLMTQAVAPIMRDQGGGAIVNITSISGLRASTLRVAYGTSKAGLAHLTRQQAAELGEYGIRVNAVAPGPVDTAMAKAVHTPAIRADYHDHIPLNRYGLETELANAICFLCGDQAGYITGQVLAVDGGFDAAGVGLPTLRTERRNQ
jgi:NAD(P)-dependent dehydrogenase (short-subunit alcohol dehydrogenase family)